MSEPKGPAGPASGTISTYDELAADPGIAALLDFDPVPRTYQRKGSWTPHAQREFIARLAVTGSPGKASEEMGKDRGGARKLYKAPEAESFRAAWDSAVELAIERVAERAAMQCLPPGTMPPSLDPRRRFPAGESGPPLPGQILNEYGEYEDEASFHRRGEEAKDSIANKLLKIRRLYLQEIAASPGKRAAFEILTELPVDWDKAARLEPQDDEPYRTSNQRKPDMVLLAESGWSFGELGYGPNRLAAARQVIDDQRAEEGLPPIDWSTERSDAGA